MNDSKAVSIVQQTCICIGVGCVFLFVFFFKKKNPLPRLLKVLELTTNRELDCWVAVHSMAPTQIVLCFTVDSAYTCDFSQFIGDLLILWGESLAFVVSWRVKLDEPNEF